MVINEARLLCRLTDVFKLFHTLLQEAQKENKFAVVDVWDALCSDRPYRKAWPVDKVRSYIQEQAGKYFDPRIVESFLREVSHIE